MLLLCCLLLGAAAEIVLYYPVSRIASPGIVRQMKADVARHVEYSRNALREAKENGTAADVLRVTVTNHILGIFAQWNSGACEEELCSHYKRELRDPCIDVAYDEGVEMCAIRYKCKIVGLGGGQKAVAPITLDEASAIHARQAKPRQAKPRQAKPRRKFQLLI